MRILVTGHRGYLGDVLVRYLARAGHEVAGLDVDLYPGSDFGAEPRATCADELHTDLRDVGAADLAGFDAVCHLAALSNDPLGALDAALTQAINHEATVRLARLAREAGVARFVFSSSCSNYGASDGALLDEGAPFQPVTAYGHSKVAAEGGCLALATDAFSPIVLRNATAYGLSSRMRFDLVLNNLVAWATLTGEVRLKSDGSAWRPLVHAEDISAAFGAVLEAPREAVHARAFNVGRDEDNLRILDVARIVGEVVPDCRVTFADAASPDQRTYRVDCRALRTAVPGFAPRWSVAAGAAELHAAIRASDLTIEDVEGPRYQRVKALEEHLAAGRVDASLRRTGGSARAV